MTFPIRVVAIADNGQEQVHDIRSLQRMELKMETLGLTLAEGKAILSAIQRVIVEQQTAHCVAAHRHCSDCGQQRHSKGHGVLVWLERKVPLRNKQGQINGLQGIFRVVVLPIMRITNTSPYISVNPIVHHPRPARQPLAGL